MRKTLIIALSATTLSLVGLGLAAAQTAPAPAPAAAPAAAAAAPAAAAALTIDSPISDLIDSAAAKAVLQKDLPKLLTYDGLDAIKSMSLRQISQYPQAELDDAKLAAIQTDLTAATTAAK